VNTFTKLVGTVILLSAVYLSYQTTEFSITAAGTPDRVTGLGATVSSLPAASFPGAESRVHFTGPTPEAVDLTQANSPRTLEQATGQSPTISSSTESLLLEPGGEASGTGIGRRVRVGLLEKAAVGTQYLLGSGFSSMSVTADRLQVRLLLAPDLSKAVYSLAGDGIELTPAEVDSLELLLEAELGHYDEGRRYSVLEQRMVEADADAETQPEAWALVVKAFEALPPFIAARLTNTARYTRLR